MIKSAKTAQEMQDEIFRKMSADEKLEVWVGLWRLAKDLTGNKLIEWNKRTQENSLKM